MTHEVAGLEIRHGSSPQGMLGLPRPELIPMGKKVLVRVIEVVLGPQQDSGKLANTDGNSLYSE